jgi:hypothetical protein
LVSHNAYANTVRYLLKTAQHSVHLTLGILRRFQAFSYASTFFWLDGFAVRPPQRR